MPINAVLRAQSNQLEICRNVSRFTRYQSVIKLYVGIIFALIISWRRMFIMSFDMRKCCLNCLLFNIQTSSTKFLILLVFSSTNSSSSLELSELLLKYVSSELEDSSFKIVTLIKM